jgi:uncharacterized protein YgbK (DUF1537 family)
VIAAVADDFTGAAELGGVGVRYGFSAEISRAPGDDTAAELAVVDTNSRDNGPAEARDKAAAAGRWLRARRPKLAYKKVDSILRGFVRVELETLLETLPAERALVVFANPSLGRIVRDGRCLVDGRPVNLTEFARDPHHPVRSSDVRDMLGASGAEPVFVRCLHEPLPPRGIVVGEASSHEDLLVWARRLPEDALAAGGAEFFGALLEVSGRRALPPSAVRSADAHSPTLLVCGSASLRSQETLQEAAKRGIPVLMMPDALFHGPSRPDVVDSWAESVANALRRGGSGVVGVGRAPQTEGVPDLAGCLAEVVARVLQRDRIGHLLAEGGATAAALARRLGWSRLAVRREVRPGVVTIHAHDQEAPLLTVKPGSYAWPPEVWEWLSKDVRAS